MLKQQMLTKFKKRFAFLENLASIFYKLGFRPNHLTAISFILAITSAYFLLVSNLKLFLITFSLACLLDALDGALARKYGQVTKFGGVFDSFIDRYVEFFVYAGIIITNIANQIITLFAMIGSFMTSYARARIEAEGIACNIGLMERPERLIILIAGFLLYFKFSNALDITLTIIAVLSNFTAFQRLYYGYKKLR